MLPPPTLGAEIPRSALLRPCGSDYRRSLIFITNAPCRGVGWAYFSGAFAALATSTFQQPQSLGQGRMNKLFRDYNQLWAYFCARVRRISASER